MSEEDVTNGSDMFANRTVIVDDLLVERFVDGRKQPEDISVVGFKFCSAMGEGVDCHRNCSLPSNDPVAGGQE